MQLTWGHTAAKDGNRDLCRLRLALKKMSHLKNVVSHENSSCCIKARRNPSEIKKIWPEKFKWVTIVHLLSVTLQVMLVIEQSSRTGSQSNLSLPRRTWLYPPKAASTDTWPLGIESIPAHQLVTTRNEVVQSLSHVQLFASPWTAAHQASMTFSISWSSLKLMSIESMMPSNHLILCRPLLFLPSIFLSIRIFSNKLALHIRWPKYWSFSISPSNEYSGLISCRIDWFDLLVERTLKSLL